MESLEPHNYLVDPNSGLKQVIAEFLNAVEMAISDAHKGFKKQWYCHLLELPGSIAISQR